MSASLCVFVQSGFCSARNVVATGSDSNIFTDDGSSGASPPLGDAMVSETLECRTSCGWANSGF
jgi:hypothetical protein